MEWRRAQGARSMGSQWEARWREINSEYQKARKAQAKLMQSTTTAANALTSPEPGRTEASSERKQRTREQKGFRLSATQKAKALEMKASNRAHFESVYSKAALELQEMVCKGTACKVGACADEIAARWRKELPEGRNYVLTGRGLRGTLDRCADVD